MAKAFTNSKSIRGALPWVGFSFGVVLIDFLTKLYFETHFYLGECREVTRFFNWVLAHNTGAAFSFLAEHDGWQRYFFVAIAFLAVVVCLYFLIKHAGEKLFSFALALILGGALGNAIDRIIYGYVIDFLDFHYQYWHWPAFNVADIAICLGAGLMVLESFRTSSKT